MADRFQLGDILELNGAPCVVVGLGGQLLGSAQVPEEHLAVWFGEMATAVAQEASDLPEKPRIEVRTVPEEYFEQGLDPVVSH